MTEPRKIEGYGWIPDEPDQRDHLYAAPPQFLADLPPTTDLRTAIHHTLEYHLTEREFDLS